MSRNSRPAWTEGMFLGPQHFQQYDRFLLNQLARISMGTSGYPFGFLEIQINSNALLEGKLSLSKASGIFSNGTPFNLPEDDALPDPLDVDVSIHNAIVSLAIPLSTNNDKDVAEHRTKGNFSRYLLDSERISDRHSPDSDTEDTVFTANLWSRLVLDNQDQSAFHTIPIARIIERREDGGIILDKQFYSCALSLAASEPITKNCKELAGLLTQRATELAKRLGTPNTADTTQLTQFLLLQILNRASPLLQHISTSATDHPEQCFRDLIQLAGELETITSSDRVATKLEDYLHRDQYTSFNPLFTRIRASLNWIPDSKVESYPVNHVKAGIYTASVPDLQLFNSARFILAAKARVTPDELSRNLPKQTTISSKAKLRELVEAQGHGVKLKTLVTVPNSIPTYENYVYFELKQDTALWGDIATSGDIALHVASTPPNLEMQIWTIHK